MNILFFGLEPPYPPNYGGRIRTYNILKQIAQNHQVTLVAFGDAAEWADSLAVLGKLCAEIILVPEPGPVSRTTIDKVRDLPARYPVSLATHFSSEMKATLQQLAQSGRFDVAHVDHIILAQYSDDLKPLPIVLTHHNIEGLLQDRSLELADDKSALQKWAAKRENKRWVRFEEDASRWSSAIVTVSDKEANYFRNKVKETPAFVVPNGVDIEFFQADDYQVGEYQAVMGKEKKQMLLYTGRMDYAPNVDAMGWFCEEIFPTIRQRRPDVELFIVGRDPSPEVTALGDIEGVTVTGFVEDVRPYFQQATISIVPLRFGAGTRLKILEAMAIGIPIVSTSLGCEGLDLDDGKDLLVADAPEDFATKVLDLLDDTDRHEQLIHQARQAVQRYDWKAVASEQEKAYSVAIKQHKKTRSTVPELVGAGR